MLTLIDTFSEVSIRIAAAIVFVGAVVVLLGLFRDRSRGRARCPRCWFRLQAQEEARDGEVVCPECGKRVKKKRALHRTRRRKRVVLLGLIVVVVGGGYPKVERDGWLSVVPIGVMTLFADGGGTSWFDETMNGVASDHWLVAEVTRRVEADQMSDGAWEAFMARVQSDLESEGRYGLTEEDYAMHERVLSATLPEDMSFVRRRDVLIVDSPMIVYEDRKDHPDPWFDVGAYSFGEPMPLEHALELLFVGTTNPLRWESLRAGWRLQYGAEDQVVITSFERPVQLMNDRSVLYDLTDLKSAELNHYPSGVLEGETEVALRSEPGARLIDQLRTSLRVRDAHVQIFGGRWLWVRANVRLHFELRDLFDASVAALSVQGRDSQSEDMRHANDILEKLEQEVFDSASLDTLADCVDCIQEMTGASVSLFLRDTDAGQIPANEHPVDASGETTGTELLDMIANIAHGPYGVWDVSHGRIVIHAGQRMGWLTSAIDMSHRFGPVPVDPSEAGDFKTFALQSERGNKYWIENLYPEVYRMLSLRERETSNRTGEFWFGSRFYSPSQSELRIGQVLLLTAPPLGHTHLRLLLDRFSAVRSGEWEEERAWREDLKAKEPQGRHIAFWNLELVPEFTQPIFCSAHGITKPRIDEMTERVEIAFESMISPEVDIRDEAASQIKFSQFVEDGREVLESYAPWPRAAFEPLASVLAVRGDSQRLLDVDSFLDRLVACRSGDWSREDQRSENWSSAPNPEMAEIGLFRLSSFTDVSSANAGDSDLSELACDISRLVQWQEMPVSAYPRVIIAGDVVIVRAPIRLLRTLRDRFQKRYR